jgi:hypothetical protein
MRFKFDRTRNRAAPPPITPSTSSKCELDVSPPRQSFVKEL